jgi:hypothetical protein
LQGDPNAKAFGYDYLARDPNAKAFGYDYLDVKAFGYAI